MSLATDQRLKEAWTEINRLKEALSKVELRTEFLEAAINAFARSTEPAQKLPAAQYRKAQ